MSESHQAVATLPASSTAPAGQVAVMEPETLIAKAIESNVPVESLERLLAMRAELKAEQAREAFSLALTEFQAGIPPIPKTKTAKVQGRNGSFTYHYADIAAIQRAISPRLKSCGLSVTFDTRQEGDTLNVVCIVHHSQGHSERTSFPVPIDRAARMNDTQKVGSALTYGRRYALCAALGIVTAEDDDDAQTLNQPEPSGYSHPTQSEGGPTRSAPPGRQNGAPISSAQHKRLEARISELSLDRERVKAWVHRAWSVEHLTQLNQAQYTALDGNLEGWAEKEGEA